jgi:CRP-like cAMP-binding protein
MSTKHFSQETVWELKDGEIIFQEGEIGQEMYIVQRGAVRISKKIGAEEIELAVLKQGEFFGEMSVLDSEPRSATAKAQGKAKILVVPRGGFLLKIRRDPTFGFELLQSLSKRIRQTNSRFLEELGEVSQEKYKQTAASLEFQSQKK